MTIANRNINVQDVTPIIKGGKEIFSDNPEARYLVARTAVGREIDQGMGGIFDGVMQLRGNVYVGETGMVEPSRLGSRGEELPDLDDARSVHYAVVENLSDDRMRVVGSMRHIIMTEDSNDLLPLQKIFPETNLLVQPAFTKPFEVSRWIQRHPERRQQHGIAVPLIQFALTDALAEERFPSYCIVEEPVARILGRVGVKLRQLAPGKFIEEYNDVNAPFEIDLVASANNLGITPDDVLRQKDQPVRMKYFDVPKRPMAAA